MCMRGVTDLLQVALKQRKVARCPRSYPGLVRESRSSRALGQQLRGDTRVEVDCLANCRDGPAPKRHTHTHRKRETQRETERDRERHEFRGLISFVCGNRMGHGNMRHTHPHTRARTPARARAPAPRVGWVERLHRGFAARERALCLRCEQQLLRQPLECGCLRCVCRRSAGVARHHDVLVQSERVSE